MVPLALLLKLPEWPEAFFAFELPVELPLTLLCAGLSELLLEWLPVVAVGLELVEVPADEPTELVLPETPLAAILAVEKAIIAAVNAKVFEIITILYWLYECLKLNLCRSAHYL